MLNPLLNPLNFRLILANKYFINLFIVNQCINNLCKHDVCFPLIWHKEIVITYLGFNTRTLFWWHNVPVHT